MPQDLYNVCQFFVNEQYEYVRHNVSDLEAVQAFQHYTTSVGAQIGTTVRVIITDQLDCICAEWVRGKGVIFPPQSAPEGESKGPQTNAK